MNTNVQIITGKENVLEVYRRACNAKHIDVICLSQNFDTAMGVPFDTEIAPLLYANETREILPESPDNREYAMKKDQKNQVRFVSGEAESDMLLFDAGVILISFDKDEPFAIEIRDPHIVKSMELQFEALWKSLGR